MLTQSITKIFQKSKAELSNFHIDNPSLDANLLIGHALGLDRAQLVSQSERTLTAEEIQKITSLVERRCQHESVARIIGEREFWSLSFGLNEATLEPRADSEILIETALDRHVSCDAPQRFLDLGTGTGCLLLSLLHEYPYATGLGIDIAPRAVEQAIENAQKLGQRPRVIFKTGNWLQDITEQFDLIICNPPYIPTSDISGLMPDVRDYDPLLALNGGKTGLDVYKSLIPQLHKVLQSRGLMIFEVGFGQAVDVAALLAAHGFKDIATTKDLGLIDRCVSAYAP